MPPLEAGLVATPINFRLAVPEILYLINNSQSKILFYDPAFEAPISGARTQMQGVRRFVSCHSGNSSMSTDYEKFSSLGNDTFSSFPHVGKAFPYLDARIVDENDTPLPPGEVGEIVCRGENVMKGYHEDPETTRAALRNGWLHTGDLARMDIEGFFYIVDQKKDMIVSGGKNIYPREIENLLIGHPAIADVAVVGIPDPDWGESVWAFVVLEAGYHVDEQGVIDFCRQFLAGYKKPKSVVFVPSIPKNALGKALKRVLKEERKPPLATDDSVKEVTTQ